jgi:hypothetical protein
VPSKKKKKKKKKTLVLPSAAPAVSPVTPLSGAVGSHSESGTGV